MKGHAKDACRRSAGRFSIPSLTFAQAAHHPACHADILHLLLAGAGAGTGTGTGTGAAVAAGAAAATATVHGSWCVLWSCVGVERGIWEV